MKDFFGLNEVVTYFFRKKDPNLATNFNLRSMHFINKLSMAIFLVCLIVLLFRLFTR